MHITIDEIDRRIHVHSFGQEPAARPGAALQPWRDGTDAWQARSFLNRYFRDAGRLHVLRHAMTLDGHDGAELARRSDDELLDAAGQRVASGIWRIACELRPAPAVGRSAPAAAMSPLLGGGGGSGRSVRASRPPPPAGRAPAPGASAPAPAATQDFPDTAAQVAQARTLQRAARDGTPFCEICEARRRAAEGAAA